MTTDQIYNTIHDILTTFDAPFDAVDALGYNPENIIDATEQAFGDDKVSQAVCCGIILGIAVEQERQNAS